MKFTMLLVTALLTGCATPPYWLAEMFDANDPCQQRNYVDKQPNWCGASSGRTYIYKGQGGAPIGYISK